MPTQSNLNARQNGLNPVHSTAEPSHSWPSVAPKARLHFASAPHCGKTRAVSRSFALLLALALWVVACNRGYRVGDEVMVEWEGKDYPAVILSASATKFKVHYEGHDEMWDEHVPRSRMKGFRTGTEIRPEPPAKVRQKALEAAQTNTYRVGDHVRVEWRERLYPAQIIDVVGKERYRVHYEGYPNEFDENVGLSRIQAR